MLFYSILERTQGAHSPIEVQHILIRVREHESMKGILGAECAKRWTGM